jgi:C-terminal processing protease CtpA/Prc
VGLVAAALTCCAASRGTIGAVIGQSGDGRLFLRDVPDQLAAARAGLRSDDEILLIDGMDVRNMSSEQVHRMLSGNVGDPVKLTVVRGEEVIRVTLRLTPAREKRAAARVTPAAEPAR